MTPPDDTAQAPPSAHVQKEKPLMVRLIPSLPPTYIDGNKNKDDNCTAQKIETE